jgi:hypothetical protein
MKISLLILICLSLGLIGAQTTILSQDFSNFDSLSGDGSSDISANLDTELAPQTGWTGSKIYKSPGRVKLGTSSVQGLITSPTVNISSNSGQADLSFTLLQYGTDTGKYIQILHAADGSSFTQIGNDILIPGTVSTIEVSISGGTASSKFRIQAKLNSSNRFYLDDILLTQDGGGSVEIPPAPTALEADAVGTYGFTATWTASSGASSYLVDLSTQSNFSSFVSPYTAYSVGGLSLELSALDPETTYYYRVRATNSAGNSAYSNTISQTTNAEDPYSGYYDPVAGLSGINLYNALHDLIDNNTYSNYDGAKLYLFQTLDNNSGVVRCVYTGQEWTVNSSYNGSSDPNTEHTYAQSWFGTAEASIKKADVHHLFITSNSVNSSRGNLPFDVVVNNLASYPSYNGYVSKRGPNADIIPKTVFEPADQHKGNLARALLYFAVRYQMSLSKDEVDMLDTLLDWHAQDPVDAAEQLRNDLVYTHQGNRNPFVDKPEYASYIWGGVLPNTVVQFSPASGSYDESDGSFTITVEITNPDPSAATSAQIELYSGSSSDLDNYGTTTISFPANSATPQSITVNITDDELIEGTEYFVLRLINVSGGDSAIAGTNSTFNLELIDNDIPVPVATAASDVDYTSFTANWSGSSEYDYLLDVSPSSDFSVFVDGYEALLCSGNSQQVEGLQNGNTYYYRIQTQFNEDSFSEYSNAISVQTLQIVELNPPTGLSATALSHEGFTARWNPVSGASQYEVQAFSQGAGNTTDLIISEYVEGSSNNKYLEIYNGTGASVDLSNYQLRLFNNGANTPNSSNTLSGSLANGQCIVYRNTGAALGIEATVSATMNFNGNDALALYKFSTESYVDVFGCIGEDPGSAWTAGTITTLDRTLRRNSDVLSGVSANPAAGFPTLATEWDVYPINNVDDLGSHSHQGQSVLAAYDAVESIPNAMRIEDLDSASEYSFRVRALNPGYSSEWSEAYAVNTTAVNSGQGSNTAIAGAACTVIIPPLAGLTDNSVYIEPQSSGTEDYSVTLSFVEQDLVYTFVSSATALNARYTLHHEGLTYTPQSVRYTYGGSVFLPSVYSLGADFSTVTVSGLADKAKGELEIILNETDDTLPVSLSAFTAHIANISEAKILWVSQSESELRGYYVLRAQCDSVAEALIQSPLIAATNTSQQQSYLYTDQLDQPGMYYYWLQVAEMNGEDSYHGPITLHYDVQDTAPQLPRVTRFESISPNPFNPDANLRFSLAEPQDVRFVIYNTKGQLVRTIKAGTLPAGNHSIHWNAKDAQDRALGSGMYIIRMEAGRHAFLRKVVLMK